MKKYDVVALGELLIDFTENGLSAQGNPMLEANPGGAPCNVLAMLNKLGKKTAFIGKVGDDNFGHMLAKTVEESGTDVTNLLFDEKVGTTLAFVHTKEDGDREFSFYRNPGADMMLKKDKQRQSYYNYYSSKKWGRADSYDLCINSSILGVEGTVKLIIQYIEDFEKKNS